MFPAQPAPLPRLREDLRLLPTRADVNGRPCYALHDPVADAYFQIDELAFQLLSAWPLHSTAQALGEAVAAQHRRDVTLDEIQTLGRFLEVNRLTLEPTGGWASLAKEAGQHRSSAFGWLLHNYLFTKIPLMTPAGFLSRTLPLVRLLVAWPLLVLLATLSLTGLLLASRRWSEFVGTFSDFWTPAGAASFAAALLVLKLFHELGHAYVATAKGCRVSSMGIAFMLGAPMAYTDVTDAWRLPRRRDRMAIDLAGVSVELAVAGVATFAWVLLPDGTAKATAFVFATTGWVMSLAVNLNPFMRFDGYFILADALNLPNLQPRSFALARWRLRRAVFGATEPCPDDLPDGLRRLVILYGLATWIYRLVLFTGIALAVYHMFFKALGILLFVIEIAVFILLPIWRELKHWWANRSTYARTGRTMISALAAATLVAAVFVPWHGVVTAPAVLEPQGFQRVFPKIAGEVRAVHVRQGDMVRAGDVLVDLASHKHDAEDAKTAARLALVEARLGRRIADRRDLAATAQLEQERATLIARREALAAERAELTIRAPVDGVIREFDTTLAAGRQLSTRDEIALITQDARHVVRGYVTADDSVRLTSGGAGVFIPDHAGGASVPVRLASVAPTGTRNIDIPVLASVHGGKIETWPQGRAGELTPVHASHAVHFDVMEPQAAQQPQTIRGVIMVEAKADSLAARAFRQILRVMVREAGA